MDEHKDDDLVVVENLGTRKGIGSHLFQKDTNFKYPVTKIPYKMASRIIASNERDQVDAVKRRKDMIVENNRRVDVNKVKQPRDKLPILGLPPEDISLENIRIGIPLKTTKLTHEKPPDGKPVAVPNGGMSLGMTEATENYLTVAPSGRGRRKKTAGK